ncbi:MAG: enoyl-CoA hydratase [Flavobacteriales bacterium]|nr:enoyl-CoA hydratase [Flavobacteriales bacterium]
MNYNNILLEISDNISYITINRPNQLNALNSETIKELNSSILYSKENNEVRCIILTGSGTKAFVAGADIKEFAGFSIEEGENLARKGQEQLFDLLENCSKPTIAAVNGFALGGGLELAMSCHIRVASLNAKMGLPEVSLGLIPGYGGTQRLSNLVGKGKAMEMICTSGMLSAEDALQWGLINSICDQEDLISNCEKIASKICRNSPMAISSAIKSVNAGFIDGVDGFEVEKIEFGKCFGTEQFTEGTTAFLEKRKANF